jgi:hypothetical protein
MTNLEDAIKIVNELNLEFSLDAEHYSNRGPRFDERTLEAERWTEMTAEVLSLLKEIKSN